MAQTREEEEEEEYLPQCCSHLASAVTCPPDSLTPTYLSPLFPAVRLENCFQCGGTFVIKPVVSAVKCNDSKLLKLLMDVQIN